MNRQRHWRFLLLVIVVPVSVYGIVRWMENRFTPLPVLGGEGHRVSGFALRNQQGRTVTPAQWENKVVVADFFFTHCPVVCPKMTRSLKRVQALYRNDPGLRIASFTVDPDRDSVAQLKTYAERMGIAGAWDLLTGSKQEIYKLARKSFLVTATDGDGGPQDFIHSELLVLLDGQQRIRGFYNGTVAGEVDELIKALERLRKKG